jgi:hypothetical protein
MDPHTLEEKRSKPNTRFQQFPGKNSVTSSKGTINALVKRAKFSSSVVELVCFIRLSNSYYDSDILCSTVTKCYPSQHVVYDATPQANWATPSPSSRKWSPLYLHIYYVFFQAVLETDIFM